MIVISKREKRLKEYAKVKDSFSPIKQKLEQEGIYERQGLRGEITFFNAARGYGFIKAGGDTFFIHIKAIDGKQYPAIGDRFCFSVGGDSRVKRAYRIDSEGI